MFVCKDCGQNFDTPVNFCNNCGSASIAPVETYSSGPIYGAPAPSTSPAGKILGIISMAVGIAAAVFSLIAFFGSFVPGAGLVYSLFFVVFGIAAIILGTMSKNKGFTGSMATVGSLLGFISTGVCALSFLISIIVLIAYSM